MDANVVLAVLFGIVFPVFCLIFLLRFLRARKALKTTEESLLERQKALDESKAKAANLIRQLQEVENDLETKTAEVEQLSPFREIVDATLEAKRRRDEGERLANESIAQAQQQAQRLISDAKIVDSKAQADRNEMLSEARSQAKKIREKADRQLEVASTQATEIIKQANSEAQQIAGDALKAKGQADLFESAAKAARNVIKGYGDEYVMPNVSVLDDLAEDFSHKDAGQRLKESRAYSQTLIKQGLGADCDYVETHRRNTAIRFVLDAYNGKVDSALTKVKHDNYGKIAQHIEDALQLVNYNGAAFRNARISDALHKSRLDELKWAVATNELKLIEREEQRVIREQIREEERARREFERARKEAEKEEKILQKAMLEARKHMEAANEQERQTYQQELEQLQAKLADAEERNERAMSMAQQTRAGHVYVISNLGSFGDEVFKVGMTRRLEPMDRVKELGDASVPFSFDVHAMIYSEDAPTLEKELHRRFHNSRLNKINLRKEFFQVPALTIREALEEMELEVHFTMSAEAREYRESLALAVSQENVEEVSEVQETIAMA